VVATQAATRPKKARARMAEQRSLERLAFALSQAEVREMGLNPHIAQRMFDQPLAIMPEKVQAILAAIGPRVGLHGVQADVGGVIRRDRTGTYQVIDGVAVVPVMGTICKRNGGGMVNSSGMVGSEAMKEVLLTAVKDPACRAILLQLDSYGGEVDGTADLADFIYAARSEKRIWAIADEAAYSAAYWIGSAAERLLVTQSGGVGSVGVITLHIDESKADEQAGFGVSVIYAGDRKADLSPFAPLSKRGRATLQARVDGVWELFTGAVAKNRGLTQKDVQGWEAATFFGSDAVANKLADGVSTFDDALMELAARPASGSVTRADDPPPDDDNPDDEDPLWGKHEGQQLKPAPSAATEVSMADKVDSAAAGAGKPDTPGGQVIQFADHQKAIDAARAEAKAEAQAAEKERGKGIRELVAMASRGPLGKEAHVIGDRLLASGASLDDARRTFIEAQAKLDESDGVIAGRTPESEALLANAPKLKSREEVLAAREQRMLAGRVGGLGVRTLHAPKEREVRP
jgi:capsid assembly protease